MRLMAQSSSGLSVEVVPVTSGEEALKKLLVEDFAETLLDAARALEAAGIPTVSVFIRAFAHVAGRLRVPRVLITPHLMGRTVGPVGDRARQRQVVEAALRLLAEASAPQTVRTL